MKKNMCSYDNAMCVFFSLSPSDSFMKESREQLFRECIIK